jgi:hypothetical protein
VLLTGSQDAFETLKALLLEMLSARGSTALFPLITRRLAESSEDVAVAAIWLLAPGEPGAAADAAPCEPSDPCLHLRAIEARSLAGSVAAADPRVEDSLRRIPLGTLDSSYGGANPEWIRHEGIESFVAPRLVHDGGVLGALGVFLRRAATTASAGVLQLIAGQLAAAVATDRAFDEVRRLQQRLDGERGMPRPGPGAPVVSEADLRRFERDNIAAALEATRGRVYGRGGAAALLGLKPTTLASRLKKLGLSPRP